jgi:hypothetical protein
MNGGLGDGDVVDDDGHGDAVFDDEDRCPSHQDLSSDEYVCPSASTPSRYLPKVRFWRFVVSLYI